MRNSLTDAIAIGREANPTTLTAPVRAQRQAGAAARVEHAPVCHAKHVKISNSEAGRTGSDSASRSPTPDKTRHLPTRTARRPHRHHQRRVAR